jgi:hypothetical protein
MPYLQDAIATAVALGAGWIVLRRVIGFVRPKRHEPACANCPTAAATPRAAPAEHPLVFVKSSRH